MNFVSIFQNGTHKDSNLIATVAHTNQPKINNPYNFRPCSINNYIALVGISMNDNFLIFFQKWMHFLLIFLYVFFNVFILGIL